jgi:predicted chitinase
LADKDDLKGITKKINGGYNGLADRERLYLLAISALRG